MPPLSLLLNLLMGVGIPAAMTLPGIIGSYPERESLKMAKEDKQKQSILMGQMLARERAKDAGDAAEAYSDKVAARQEGRLNRNELNTASILQLIGQMYGQAPNVDYLSQPSQMAEASMMNRQADMSRLAAQTPSTIWDRILG